MNDSEQHIASAFDRDLEAIQAHIMKMGGLVEAAIMGAARSLETRDEELAQQVRAGDKAIDALAAVIDDETARLQLLLEMSGRNEAAPLMSSTRQQAQYIFGADNGQQPGQCRPLHCYLSNRGT